MKRTCALGSTKDFVLNDHWIEGSFKMNDLPFLFRISTMTLSLHGMCCNVMCRWHHLRSFQARKIFSKCFYTRERYSQLPSALLLLFLPDLLDLMDKHCHTNQNVVCIF